MAKYANCVMESDQHPLWEARDGSRQVSPLITKDHCGAESCCSGLWWLHPGRECTPDIHPDADEIYYVVSGEGRLLLGDEEYTVRKGMTIFIPRNVTHQIKKMSAEQILGLRERLHLEDEIPESSLQGDRAPYFRPDEGSPEFEYMIQRRRALGGCIPKRRIRSRRPLTLPDPSVFVGLSKGSQGREVSTTMAHTNLLRDLMRDAAFGPRVVPIIPDEARTFGMDSLFREFGIYAPFGQLYEPVDHELLLSYSEGTDGQLLEEGITEAGSMSSFIAAGTSYANLGVPMVPFYTFYSMFGFQRVGDLIWSAADSRARGFLMGATAGRTTLHGEGLQHQDGHSLILAGTVPPCQAYDPAFAYEIAHIIESGLHRMYGENPENVYFYMTIYNEPYAQPAEPEGLDVEGLLRGIYLYRPAPEKKSHTAQILVSGVSMPDALRAAELLAEDWDVAANVWSVTRSEERRVGKECRSRWSPYH